MKSLAPEAVTLSIGDGANDVSMIVAAHVGVGLCGKEGAQAARSADVALAEFRLLRRVVFGHGREAYRRNAMVCIYSFYKWPGQEGSEVANIFGIFALYKIIHCTYICKIYILV